MRSRPGPGPSSSCRAPAPGGRPGAAGGVVVRRYWLALPLALATLVVAGDLGIPVLRAAAALFLLLGAPTLLLHQRAGLPHDSAPARWSYAFGCALLALLVGGLLLNTVLPLVGNEHPLRPAPLAITWRLLNAGLLAWRPEVPLVPSPSWTATAREALEARFEWAQALAAGSVLARGAGRRTPQQRRRRRPRLARRRPSRQRRWWPCWCGPRAPCGATRGAWRWWRPACCGRPRCAAGTSPATTSRRSSSPSS